MNKMMAATISAGATTRAPDGTASPPKRALTMPPPTATRTRKKVPSTSETAAAPRSCCPRSRTRLPPSSAAPWIAARRRHVGPHPADPAPTASLARSIDSSSRTPCRGIGERGLAGFTALSRRRWLKQSHRIVSAHPLRPPPRRARPAARIDANRTYRLFFRLPARLPTSRSPAGRSGVSPRPGDARAAACPYVARDRRCHRIPSVTTDRCVVRLREPRPNGGGPGGPNAYRPSEHRRAQGSRRRSSATDPAVESLRLATCRRPAGSGRPSPAAKPDPRARFGAGAPRPDDGLALHLLPRRRGSGTAQRAG